MAQPLPSTAIGVAPFVEEAIQWVEGDTDKIDSLAGERLPSVAPLSARSPGARVLVADDNADMREYLRRLLGQYWTVETVADGDAALSAIDHMVPDLLLADVMMPTLDGFTLLRRIREHRQIATLPVILVTARAGEEVAIEGLLAGADDYITKPFSARELVARVGAQLELAQMRRESQAAIKRSEAFLRTAVEASGVGVGTGCSNQTTLALRAGVRTAGDRSRLRGREQGLNSICSSRRSRAPRAGPDAGTRSTR